MGTHSRSQEALLRRGRVTSDGIPPEPVIPPITGFAPTNMPSVAAGTVGRTVYTLGTVTGGQAPYTLTIMSNPDSIGVGVVGTTLRSTTNPTGAVGAHVVTLKVADSFGNSFNQDVTLTLT